MHNFGVSMAEVNAVSFALSLLVALAGLVIVLLTVLLSWQQERKVLRVELAGEVGILLSSQEYEVLTRRWRNPLRRRRADRARMSRLQQLVELAQRKDRLQQLEPREEPAEQAKIELLRTQLLQSA